MASHGTVDDSDSNKIRLLLQMTTAYLAEVRLEG
jgi:hypothetical protein